MNLSLSTINIKSSKNITKIKELQKDFNNLHPLIRLPSYDELVEKNLDVMMKNYLKFLDYAEKNNDRYSNYDYDLNDLERYYELRRKVTNSDSTLFLGERWGFWKNRIEKKHIQSFNDTDESSRKAILVVRHAFQNFGKKVGEVLSELIKEGKKTVVGARELEEAETELAEIQKMKRDAERIKDYIRSAALNIFEVSLERDIKFFAIDQKRQEKSKKKKIEEDIKKAQFFSERNGKKNVMVRDIEGYGNLEMYISDWESSIRSEINWLNISWEIKGEMIKKLEEILHSKAPFYFSTSFPETKNSYTFEKMLEDNKNSVLYEIARALEEVGLSQNDLLIENQNYQDQLQTAVENWDLVGIEDIKDRLLMDIKRDKSSDNDQPDKNDKKDTENYSLERNNKWRAGCIRNIINSMNQEPKITNEDLSIENQNWEEKLNACRDSGEAVFTEISKIYIRIKTNIRQVKEEKQKVVELNNIANKYQGNNNQVSKDEMVNDLKKLNLNLGNEDAENKRKLRKAKRQMKQHDSELYFSSSVKLIEEEVEKLEAERKIMEESKSDLEIEWNEEERKLLNGEITNPSKKEELIEAIENKLETKKKIWSWYKQVKEWSKWLKTKARLLFKNNKVAFENQKSQIEEEIKNLENSSNTFDKKAYQANNQEMKNLLSELRIISQDNTENNDSRISPLVFVGGMAILVSSLVLIILHLRKRQRN